MSRLPPNLMDQIQVFVDAVDAGTFNAVAKRRRRAQSAVSYAISNLEDQLGLSLFDRSSHTATPSPQARALLRDARGLVADAEAFLAKAAELSRGVEPDLRLVVDRMFPAACLMAVLAGLRDAYPATRVTVDPAALREVWNRVETGRAQLGLGVAFAGQGSATETRIIGAVAMVAVAAADHPLVIRDTPAAEADLRGHTQIVLWSPDAPEDSRESGVFGTRTLRAGDLITKRQMIEAGLGWGQMPDHLIADGLSAGQLGRIDSPVYQTDLTLPLGVTWDPARPLGPAARFLIDTIKLG